MHCQWSTYSGSYTVSSVSKCHIPYLNFSKIFFNILRAEVRYIRTSIERPKASSCQLPYQRHSSSADCATELFKGSNESDSLLDCTRKKFFGWGLQIFCKWRHKWSSLWAILAHVAWPRAQALGQSISLKFSLETRLESESFEPLIDFLAF